jgi:hypothetical protein
MKAMGGELVLRELRRRPRPVAAGEVKPWTNAFWIARE